MRQNQASRRCDLIKKTVDSCQRLSLVYIKIFDIKYSAKLPPIIAFGKLVGSDNYISDNLYEGLTAKTLGKIICKYLDLGLI